MKLTESTVRGVLKTSLKAHSKIIQMTLQSFSSAREGSWSDIAGVCLFTRHAYRGQSNN